MMQVRGWMVLAAFVVALVAGSSAGAANDRPMSLSEVKRLIEKDQTPQQVLETMAERGVSFKVSKATARILGIWGFSEEQVEIVRKIAAGEDFDLNPKPEEEPGDDEPGPDRPEPRPGPGPEPEPEPVPAIEDRNDDRRDAGDGEYKVGYPNEAGWHKAEQKRIERAIKNAGLGYKRIELSRCTIYCNNRRAGQLVPMLRKLEAELIKRFPDSISNASSPESAHIVIVDGASEWSNWVDACFDSYEADGIKYRFGPEDNPRPQLVAGTGYMLPALTATHADKLPDNEAVSRYAAYSVGHLMMGMAAGPDQPDGLRTGFGNLAEAIAHRTPSIMVYSYVKRELGTDDAWKRMVQQQFKDKKIKSASDPWALDTSTMAPEHYAMAWSMVTTLAEAPKKFAEAVAMVRNKEKRMGEAVQEAYGLNDRKLLEIWYRFVSR